MKMKFLYVFCVVLYFQSGDCLYPVNSGTSILYQYQKSNTLNNQRNVDIPPDLAYSLHNNPPRINIQEQNPIEQPVPVTTISEPYLRQRKGFREQQVSRPFIKTISEKINEPPQQENIILANQGFPEYSSNQPIIQVNKQPLQFEVLDEPLKSASYEMDKIPLITKNNSQLKPGEDLRLELQGISPEYAKYLMKEPLTQQHQDQSMLTHAYQNADVDDLKHLPSKTDKSYPTATFQNPTAEPVYNLNQALPYRVNIQQPLNKPQGKTYPNNVLFNTRRLQDIYKSEPPKKRYMIIHPNGRIEHIDQLESVIARHPNYIMVKSDDIIKNVQDKPKAFQQVQAPPAQQNSIVEPKIRNNEQSNIVKQANNIESFSLSDTKNSAKVVDSVNNAPILKHNVVSILTETNFEKDMVNKTIDPDVTDEHTIKLNEISPTIDNPTAVEEDETNQLNNSTELNTSRIEYQNVTISNVLLNNSSATVEPIISATNFTEISINSTPTAFSNESIILSDVQSINVNDTHNLQIQQGTNDLVTSVSSTPLPNTENTTEKSTFLVPADEQFWDKLINENNSQNVIYFLFLPPKPDTEKETKTTIYPNGTTVEEVIETKKGKDGEPKIIKSITVTHKNETIAYSDK